jgi:hypothetical protein
MYTCIVNLHELDVHCSTQDFNNQVHYYLTGKLLLYTVGTIKYTHRALRKLRTLALSKRHVKQ